MTKSEGELHCVPYTTSSSCCIDSPNSVRKTLRCPQEQKDMLNLGGEKRPGRRPQAGFRACPYGVSSDTVYTGSNFFHFKKNKEEQPFNIGLFTL